MIRLAGLAVVLALLVFGRGTGGCRSGGTGDGLTAGELQHLVPKLHPEMVEHLVADGDQAFRAFAETCDRVMLFEAPHWITPALDTTTVAGFERSARRLLPVLVRLTAAYAEAFSDSALNRYAWHLVAMPAPDALQLA